MTNFVNVLKICTEKSGIVVDILREDETLDDLQLKGIHIIQKKEAFRFGVDAVLLANFARIRRGARVIDLCTGTGIIPFIIAGKTEAGTVTGLEIQEEMVEMALRSVKYNGMEGRLDFINGDLTDRELIKTIQKADIVTVNPPYKLRSAGLLNPKDKNAIARHEVCCTLEDVIIASRILLKDNGRLYMVHRPERLADILCLMRKHKIEPKAIRMVHPNTKKAPNIVLVEGQRDGGAFLKWEPPLYVYKDEGGYSEEIDRIYGREVE
jgi:tRNA1Val (adenine37-N6)-methyltransferase